MRRLSKLPRRLIKVALVHTLDYTMFGKEFNSTAASTSRHHHCCKSGIQGTRRRPNLIVLRGTLDNVTSGSEEMKGGKLSGKKLVYKMAA
ncbi:hypothetical protein IAR55_000634 [Kwoniella newhampshirensis]|uniref:Uncharacterized protein n=1 Tax=Kwoniella newhampshirensis TaxID=1651941 RepID=A0AAW0Z7B9_9TREE